ncbi:MAG: VWA domain-containing protein [Pseudomonadota bacterium]
MIHFAWPWLWLVLPLPYLVWRWAPPLSAPTGVLHAPIFARVQALMAGGAKGAARPTWALAIAALAWAALVCAAARPEWLGETVSLNVSGRDVMLAIDLSGSMARPDFSLQGEPANRLDVIKAVAGDFIERRTGDRVGLILFGRRAYLHVPLTFDRRTVRTLLDEAEIGLAGQETAIGDALGLATKHLRERPQQSRVLVLMTDGAQTAGELPPLEAAKLAADSGLRVYTIGVGADSMQVGGGIFGPTVVNPSADLDEDTLQQIADLTQARYFRAKDTRGMKKIYVELDNLEPVVSDQVQMRPVHALFYWPLAFSLVLAALVAARQFGGLTRWRRT